MPRTRRSDHAPIMLRTRGNTKGGGQFRVEHWWLQNETFQDAWSTDWISDQDGEWEEKYKTMKKNIIGWKSKINTPQKEVAPLQNELLKCQTVHPMLQNHNREELLEEYEAAEDRLNTYWCQRSRIQWAELGDRNTSFFHAVASQRKRRNKIVAIRDETGQLVTNEKQLAGVFVKYFKELYTS
jgi:hypothetical protein